MGSNTFIELRDLLCGGAMLLGAKGLMSRYAELGDFGPVADARMATLKAGIAALEGRSTEAIALYKEGLRGWRAVHAVIDEAFAGIDAAELLDPNDPAVAEIIASTRAILERLRAKPYLDAPRRGRRAGGCGDTSVEEASHRSCR